LSLKNDIEMVKEELTSEEKFFEKAVVTERFVKKYKNVMIGGVIAITLFVAGSIVSNITKQNTIDNANLTLAELQLNASNPAKLARLTSLSPALSDLWQYSQAIVNKDMGSLQKLAKSKTILVGDLASYEVAQNSNDLAKLEAYSAKDDAIYADLARMQSAVILMNEKKIDEAHKILEMINLNSPLAQVASALMHYGVK
jgi:hypothetical protein